MLLLILIAQRDADIRDRFCPDVVLIDDDIPFPYLHIEKHKSHKRTKTAAAAQPHTVLQRPGNSVPGLSELEAAASRGLTTHDDAESAKSLKGEPYLDSDDLDVIVARDYGITEDQLRAVWPV